MLSTSVKSFTLKGEVQWKTISGGMMKDTSEMLVVFFNWASLGILLEDIFRQLIRQRIRIKDILRIFKDKDFWVI